MKSNFLKTVYGMIVCTLILTGCSGKYYAGNQVLTKSERSAGTEIIKKSFQETAGETVTESIKAEPEIIEADWSEYFEGLNGAAVLYDASDRQYTIYNRELASTRRSPCSTFKIISSLIGLEKGLIEPDRSTRKWSGETFWNENWNKDIDFGEAFSTSCVWYFRQVIDDLGESMIKEELDRLKYGNCDISDWEGRKNTNNNPALTGFWIESSLEISPKEQTEVMRRIFGSGTVYSEKTLHELKKVMLVPDQDSMDIAIYGKTGLGKKQGVTIDAWFTGFSEYRGEKIYFCVYLGRTDGMDVSSSWAKDIAIRLIKDYSKDLNQKVQKR